MAKPKEKKKLARGCVYHSCISFYNIWYVFEKVLEAVLKAKMCTRSCSTQDLSGHEHSYKHNVFGGKHMACKKSSSKILIQLEVMLLILM